MKIKSPAFPNPLALGRISRFVPAKLLPAFAALCFASFSTAHADTTVFQDTFAGSASGTSTLNSNPVSPANPSNNATAYQEGAQKTFTTTTVSPGHLVWGFGGSSSADGQIAALFTKYPVSLVNVGDYIQMTTVFTNKAFILSSTFAALSVGLFDGGQVQGPPGGLPGNLGTAQAGYWQNWAGYIAHMQGATSVNNLYLRPAQSVSSINNQDLCHFQGTPAWTNLAQASSSLALTGSAQYSIVLNVTLSAASTHQVTYSLYSGTDTTATPLFTQTATTTTLASTKFDGMSLGMREATGASPQLMDVNSITVVTNASTTVVPVIASQPSPSTQTVSVGAPVSYSVSATGGGAALSYQWQKSTDGGSTYNNISGATSSTYSIGTTALSDSGMYRVQISDVAGQITSNAVTLNVTSGTFAPQINGQPSPASLTVLSGSSASFTVQVSGNPQPSVQWQKSTDGGVNFSNVGTSNQNSPNTFTISSTQLSDAGWYRVVATNTSGTATSNNATLTVNQAPAIATQPVGSIVASGSSYTLTSSVTASNPAPTYQWQISSDGVTFMNVSGGTSASLIVTGSTTTSGYYRVIATNTAGSGTSSLVYFGIPSTQSVTFAPGNNATSLSIDQQLRLVFPSPPKLGLSGVLTVRDAADNSVVATIDRSTFVSYTPGNTSVQVIPNAAIRSVQGSYSGTVAGTTNYYYMPIAIYGNEAWVTLSQRLSYGHTYYVTMDSTLLLDSNNASYPGVSGSNTWRFSTKASGPATPTASTGLTTITVGQDGAGDFATFQGAFDWIPTNNTLARKVVVKPGIYRDSATLGFSRNFVTIAGESTDRTAAQLIYPFIYFAAPNPVFTAGSLRVESSDVTVRDITVDNIIYQEYHPTGSVSSGAAGAFAGAINTVATTGNRIVFDNVLIKGGQDTLYDIMGIAYFYKCEIWGSVDFIYGAALDVFDQCNIVEIRPTGGPVSAPNTLYAQPYGLVFLNCQFPLALAANGYPYDVNAGSTTYMRAWGQDGATAIINCSIGAQMSAKRWDTFGSGGENTCRAREYGTTLTTGGSTALGNAYWNNTIDPDYTANPSLSGTDPLLAGSGTSNRVAVTVNPSDYTLAAIFGNAYYNLNGWMPSLAPRILSQPTGQSAVEGQAVMLSVSGTGTPLPTYQWFKGGNPITGATNATLSIASVALSDAGSYSVALTNSAGTTTSAVASVTVTSALANWAASYGMDANAPGFGNADPDQDGIPNLLEYYLGGNPAGADPGLRPTVTVVDNGNGKNLVISYLHALGAIGVQANVEFSSDLATWQSVTSGVNGTVQTTPVDASHEQVTVTIPYNGPRLFARLRVSN